MMNAALRKAQQGMVTVVAALFLVAGVLFVLAQTFTNIGKHSLDTARQMDATAALMLAESGLQRAQAIVGAAANANGLTNTVCTGISGTTTYSLGRGTFSIPSATSTPATCSPTGSLCTKCSVQAKGTVGDTVRTLEMEFDFTTVNGTTGVGQTVTMVLKNTYDRPALAVFNMGFKRQAAGGNADATMCTNGATGCGERWNVEASNGNNSVGALGVTVDIAANTLSKEVSHWIERARAYSEVGALFPAQDGATTAPTVIGSYWNDCGTGAGACSGYNNPGNKTVGTNASDTGQTNSGATSTSAACTSVPLVYASGSHQTCTNWCYGGDTLVYGVAGRAQSGSVTEQINAISFNSTAVTGWPAQNIAMTRVVHFPNTDGSIVNATSVYSEVWKAYNPAYMFSPASTALGGSNYPNQLLGSVGRSSFATSNINNTNTMTVSAASTTSKICIGDSLTVVSSGGAGRFSTTTSTLVISTPDNTTGSVTGPQCSASAGSYRFSPNSTGGNMSNPTLNATSSKLVAKASMGTITLNTGLLASGSVVMTPTALLTTDTTTYQLSTSTLRTLQSYTQGTASSTTIYLPTGSAIPDVNTIVAVYNSTGTGTGEFQAQTRVSATATSSFTIDKAVTTNLVNAGICGGTCAFFSNPSSTTSTTTFAITKSSGTNYWSGGFTCLSGVKDSIVQPVTSSTTSGKTWREAIQ